MARQFHEFYASKVVHHLFYLIIYYFNNYFKYLLN